MAHVADHTLDKMLQTLPPDARKAFKQSLKNVPTHTVHCLSKTCKGKIVGEIYENAQPDPYVLMVEDETSGVHRNRKRLDGQWGFECKCGQDSIVAKEEKGVLPGWTRKEKPMRTEPNNEELLQIALNVSNRKSDPYQEVSGVKNVDGFEIRRAA